MVCRTLATAAVCAGIVGAGIAAIAQHRSTRGDSQTSIVAGRFYAIETSEGAAEFDLVCEAGARYLLIIGNPVSDTRSGTVTLSRVSGPPAAPTRRSRPIERIIACRSPQPGLFPHQSSRRDRLVRRASFATSMAGTTNAARAFRGERGPGQTHQPSLHGPCVNDECRFCLHVTDGSLNHRSHYTTVTSRVIRMGKRVRVCLDRQQDESELAGGLVDELLAILDDDLIPRMTNELGPVLDVDHDGRLTVLLSPWLGHLQGGTVSLNGFVRVTDFHPRAQRPFGNQCDMMYINSAIRPGPGLRTLLAHELTHVISCSRTCSDPSDPGALAAKQDWLNEGIAHVAEVRYSADWSNLDHRICEFLDAPESYPLVVDTYFAAGLHRNHGCRGATFLFNQWCSDRFGFDLVGRIIDAPECGADGISRLTGYSFRDLFRRWTIALAMASSSLSEPGTNIEIAADQLQSVPLRGRIGSRQLNGPHVHAWRVSDHPAEFRIVGTAAAYVEIAADCIEPRCRIRVESADGIPKQLTITRVPLATRDSSPSQRANREPVTFGKQSGQP